MWDLLMDSLSFPTVRSQHMFGKLIKHLLSVFVCVYVCVYGSICMYGYMCPCARMYREVKLSYIAQPLFILFWR